MTPQDFSDALPARWNDGLSAAGYAVLVRTAERPKRLLLFFPDGRECSMWRPEQTELASPKDELPLRLAKRTAEEGEADAGREGERLTVEDAAGAQSLLAWLAPESSRKKKRALRRWVLAVVAAWCFVGLFYVFSPFLFELAAGWIPRAWEEDLGKSARESIITMLSLFSASSGPCDLGAGQADLEALKKRLTQGADTAGYSFDIVVLDSPMINAFALPGGYMAVTTSLIQACASADELAGVLAHEMAHVTQRHGTSRMLREQSWQLIGRLLAGSEAGAAWMRDLALFMLGNAFDRDQEREADRLGAGRLLAANIQPAALADFFGRLLKKDESAKYAGVLSYIASHPDLSEREKYLRTAAAGQKGATPALSAAAWKRLRQAAGGKKPGKTMPEKPR